MRFLCLILVMISNLPSSNGLKCYTCEKTCDPEQNSWNVMNNCTGSCRWEFAILPGNEQYTECDKKVKVSCCIASCNVVNYGPI